MLLEIFLGIITFVFVLVSIKLITFLNSVQKLLDEDVKKTLTHTNSLLNESERTIKKAGDMVDDSKVLVKKITSFTEKGENIKSSVNHYLQYIQFGFDLFNKVKNKKKGE